MEFYEQIANDLQCPLSDVVIAAIEAACITTQEYEADPVGCRRRVMGAIEELLQRELVMAIGEDY